MTRYWNDLTDTAAHVEGTTVTFYSGAHRRGVTATFSSRRAALAAVAHFVRFPGVY